jgi:adenylate kinase
VRIAITGTPGTGKTAVAELVSESLKLPVLSANYLAKNHVIERDEPRDTDVVDVEAAAKSARLKKDCIVEGHLAHFFPADIVIVLRCRPAELKKRLEKKGWKKEKIRENIEAEGMNIISLEARDKNKTVFDIDTTELTVQEVAERIIEAVVNKLKNDGLDFMEDLIN